MTIAVDFGRKATKQTNDCTHSKALGVSILLLKSKIQIRLLRLIGYFNLNTHSKNSLMPNASQVSLKTHTFQCEMF